MNKLFFDTETNGLPTNWKAKSSQVECFPRIVQIAWIVTDERLNTLKEVNLIIKPDGWEIPKEAMEVHGITMEIAHEKGITIAEATQQFEDDLKEFNVEELVAHNISFDEKVVESEIYRQGKTPSLSHLTHTCTMKSSVDLCKLPNPRFSGSYKWPRLSELHQFLFNEDFDGAHDALNDIKATVRSYKGLVDHNVLG
jgi:DNA polymerase III epsilon subunit-like protein